MTIIQQLELTFAIIKPHIVKNPISLRAIRNLIIESNFKVVRSKRHRITTEEAAAFYKEHKQKFFYNRLVTFMVSGPSDLYILTRNDAIKKWRELMGPTKVFKTQYEAPDTIRGLYGLSDTRNATHGSDSPESVCKEIGIFFPDFMIDEWFDRDEAHFRKGLVEFDDVQFIHKVNLKL